MELTDIKIYPVRNAEPLLAFVRVIIDDCFLVRDIKIIKGRSGIFVAMPSRRDPDGGFRDIAHPINRETRQAFEDKILSAWRAQTDKD